MLSDALRYMLKAGGIRIYLQGANKARQLTNAEDAIKKREECVHLPRVMYTFKVLKPWRHITLWMEKKLQIKLGPGTGPVPADNKVLSSFHAQALGEPGHVNLDRKDSGIRILKNCWRLPTLNKCELGTEGGIRNPLPLSFSSLGHKKGYRDVIGHCFGDASLPFIFYP